MWKQSRASQVVRVTGGRIGSKTARTLKADGYGPVSKHSRWVPLKRPEDLAEPQAVKLKGLPRYSPKAARAYLLREEFQRCRE